MQSLEITLQHINVCSVQFIHIGPSELDLLVKKGYSLGQESIKGQDPGFKEQGFHVQDRTIMNSNQTVKFHVSRSKSGR
jgi:hypothetical protein